jgi:hypothetical protein
LLIFKAIILEHVDEFLVDIEGHIVEEDGTSARPKYLNEQLLDKNNLNIDLLEDNGSEVEIIKDESE